MDRLKILHRNEEGQCRVTSVQPSLLSGRASPGAADGTAGLSKSTFSRRAVPPQPRVTVLPEGTRLPGEEGTQLSGGQSPPEVAPRRRAAETALAWPGVPKGLGSVMACRPLRPPERRERAWLGSSWRRRGSTLRQRRGAREAAGKRQWDPPTSTNPPQLQTDGKLRPYNEKEIYARFTYKIL